MGEGRSKERGREDEAVVTADPSSAFVYHSSGPQVRDSQCSASYTVTHQSHLQKCKGKTCNGLFLNDDVASLYVHVAMFHQVYRMRVFMSLCV